MKRPHVSIVGLSLLLCITGPCAAPQLGCDVMSAVDSCNDGSAPQCATRYKWSRGRVSRQWSLLNPRFSAYCGFDNGGERSVALFIFLPYLMSAALVVALGLALARRT